MKTILILGAGFMQGIAIREAKKMGLRVIAVDGNPNAVCASEAHIFENIDLKDIEALTAFAKKFKAEHGLDGVFTAATDFSYSVAKIAEACNLAGHSANACLNATNKVLMRECFKKTKVPSVGFFSVERKSLPTLENLLVASGLSFPLVVKPADNMGARGCQKVRKFEALQAAVENALDFSRTETAIVEKFIDGKEFSLEGIIVGEKFYVTALADRHIFFPPYFIEMGHSIPADVSRKDALKLCAAFEQGARALGLSYGVCKGDIFLSNGKAFIGEIAARLSGGYMSGWTVPYSSHIPVTHLALQLSLGETDAVCAKLEKTKCPPTRKNTKVFCAERAWISIPGEVAAVYGLEDASKVCGVENIFPRAEKNSRVVFPSNNVEKCGNVLATARSYKKACSRAEQAAQKIILRLKPNDGKTEAYLKCKEKKSNDGEIVQPGFFALTDEQQRSLGEKLYSEKDLTLRKIIVPKKNETSMIVFPVALAPFLRKVYDVQGRSLLKALKQMFRIEPELVSWLCENTQTETGKVFWQMFLRGGIQGGLYAYDSQKQ